MQSQSMPQRGHRCAANSFGSILSIESIETWITCDRMTDVLVLDARGVTQEYQNDVLKEVDGVPKIYTGILLDALLDNASHHPVDPDDSANRDVTGLRHTAAAIVAAAKEDRVRDLALAWLDHMIYPSKFAVIYIIFYIVLST